MSDVGKLVLDMKTISENSYKENIKSLRKTTNEIKKTEIIPEKNIILKIKEKEYKAALEGKLKKAPNFQILSDCYRKQINKAFVNYNPNIHISNIHKLSQTEQETQKEYESRLSEIDKFIYDLKSKENKGFRKPFSMDKKIKKNKTNEEKNNTSGINNSSVGYTVATAESENNSQILPTQIINIYGKKKPKVEVKRKFPEKEKREKELNLMNNVLKNIDNSISKENIGNYFDRYKEIPGTEIDQQRHIFFNGLGKANKLLTEIQEVLHYKDADDNANVKRKQTTYESDNLIVKDYYKKLSKVLREPAFRSSNFYFVDNMTGGKKDDFIAYIREEGDNHYIVIVNYSSSQGCAYVPIHNIKGYRYCLIHEALSNQEYIKTVKDAKNGMFVCLDAWETQIFQYNY
jgi:hypothetical protein